ncbi:MAG: hypothetical protein ACXVFN_03580 [Solirubrobacteraceae bacterium]
MLKSSQFTRPAVVAATVLALGASPAIARQADLPIPAKPAVAAAPASSQQTPPRVDGMGVRPAGAPAAVSAAPAQPITKPSDGSGGQEWLLIPLAALGLASLLVLAVVRTGRHRAHPFRPRRV